MKIDNILKRLVSVQEDRKLRILYDSFEKVLQPSNFTNESRLATFMQLLMLCSEERDNKRIADFTRNILAFEYFVSAGHAKKALPFLNQALECHAELAGMEIVSIKDKDKFIGDFRSYNIKGKWKREYLALKNTYIICGAAQKLGLDLSLEELPADLVPNSNQTIDFVQMLLLCVMAAWLIMCGLDEYQTSRFTDNPMSLSEAVQGMDILAIIAGFALFIWNILWLFLQYSPESNRLKGRFSFSIFKG